MLNCFTFLTVAAAGAATISTVAAVTISATLVSPGVTVVPIKSTHEVETSTKPAADVTTCNLLNIEARLIMIN